MSPSIRLPWSDLSIKLLIFLVVYSYSETINILYTSNTFAILDNDALFDLYSTILPKRFLSIQSLVIHWQFRNNCAFQRDEPGKIAPPWDVATWESAITLLARMPSISHLSIFIQGPFYFNCEIVDMLNHLRIISVKAGGDFVIRVPWPLIIALTGVESIDRRMENQGYPFRVIRPAKVLLDRDIGPDPERQKKGDCLSNGEEFLISNISQNRHGNRGRFLFH
ncbi:hypothetical protein K432DRAFT_409652 [Lepidopterella palustris CBS 459.81]|uniref:DUF7730 domain-containing protein n=1 Tax=Lepidopterella palustris CBS 459.81 TaxID=1314670 RepID=A0A8E2J9V5_9PEZI|nr:hypothetical protein K432DRAFT_409652 [Lepidopterella palustris CBS 459.81]